MPRTIRVATVQMDAAPADTLLRLERAEALVAEAVSSGAQLAVLPELFNTGYEYHERNYALAEPMDGPTVTWMKATAAANQVHLAGSLLIIDEEDIYNAAILVAPDGELWRYNKQYPFSWERAYFREDRHITIARTALGRLGLMICWDTAHPDLWQRYAGKVDALVVPSCPPKMSSSDLVFPDGLRVNLRDLGGPWRNIHTETEFFPGVDLDEHAAWMGVPVIQSTGSGRFRSRLPEPVASLTTLLSGRPDLWPRMIQAPEVVMEAGYDLQSKVVDSQGRVVARVLATGDGYALADVNMADRPPTPGGTQPAMRTSPLVYLFSDAVAAGLTTGSYRQGIRREWGSSMAPVDPRTRVWITALAAVAAAGWMAGQLTQRGRAPRLRLPRVGTRRR